jgi:hypothetical protein
MKKLTAVGGLVLTALGTALSFWVFAKGCASLEKCDTPSAEAVFAADEAVEKFFSEVDDICSEPSLQPMLVRSPCESASIARGHLSDGSRLGPEDLRLVRLHVERQSQAIHRLCIRLDKVGHAVADRRAAAYRGWDRQRRAELDDLLGRSSVTWAKLNKQRKDQRRRLELAMSV